MPYFARIEEMELLFLKTRARGVPAEKPSKNRLKYGPATCKYNDDVECIT
jgi:hypothetical protein